ncbi:MAG TPA: histidine phosphatase family protein [Nanoarchaeota archaeon]|nr:MAG: putative phosphoglycerate mutase [archaeon GW2011_AR6]MBS3082554.1 histidine phosphatase family protein [Candidatus Pacearchaeota archaeon]HIH17485.1 histidine phosphatase family protein [Nanoarchaeota archaeon]HIH33932.1 histidine phosphatase family protein [Nanoarchaeota archaeon]HIH51777.1 histidine phosphatase family protein [Nanoarchaeota archaeon]
MKKEKSKEKEVTEVFLVRHAQSKLNLKDIFSSDPKNDLGLSAKGKEQAKKLAQRLKKEKIAAIYSSDLRRAVETIKPLADLNGYKIIFDKALREHDMGKYEMMTQEELESRFLPIAKNWFSKYDDGDPSKVVLGESFPDAEKRCWDAFLRIVKQNEGQRIVIVTHQAPAKFIVGKLFGGLRYFKNFTIGNASVSRITCWNQGKNFKLQYLNDMSHYTM